MSSQQPAPVESRTPDQAWQALAAGNLRFASGTATKMDQDLTRRAAISGGQRPFALVFGCSDSRVAAEIVFDQGLGHLFVVRTAGHVVDSGVLGSMEFGVDALAIPLVVVLGHDRCGAVAATLTAVETGVLPTGFVRDIVERVTPSVLAARRTGQLDGDQLSPDPLTTNLVEAEHVRQTARLLVDRSAVLADRVARGEVAVVGLVYDLDEGAVRVVDSIGELDPDLSSESA